MSLALAEKADRNAPSALVAAPAPPGGVFFAVAARQAEASLALTARRYLVVDASAGVQAGALRGAIEDAVEDALALRGALPKGTPVGALAEETVRDQVLRARALGASGIALQFPRLSGPLSDGPLGVEESALISAWIAAAQRGPVVVLFDERDRDARVLAPRRLAELASAMKLASNGGRPASMSAPFAGGLASEPWTGSPSDPPPSLRARESSIPPSREIAKVSEPSPATVKEGALERAAPAPADEEEPPTLRFREQPPPPIMAMPRRGVLKKRPRRETLAEEPSAPAQAEGPPAVLAKAIVLPEAEEPIEAAPIEAAPIEALPIEALPIEALPIEAPSKRPASSAASRFGVASTGDASRLGSTSAGDASRLSSASACAGRVVNAAEWRAHAMELDKARGPKPAGVIDRLFTSRYMPLLGAMARGEVDGAVKAVVDAFRTNFEHSYREAFSALRVTGKRPPMVFDAPDIAARIGRLNGARVVKLLLVDAMRFDIGERVASRLGERLSGRAVCVERTLLWSALPTTTPTQMALLGRGPEGLREADLHGEPEGEIIRGRAVGTVRRERIGAREVMKLDLVEARLRVAGAGYEDRVESIAEEVAQITIRYVETLPPRTLLFMFGDHGFRWPSGADGRSTGAATQGGVSPEEVLVPGHAWLIGGVH